MAAIGGDGVQARDPRSVAKALLSEARRHHMLIGRETSEEVQAIDAYRDLGVTQLARIRQDVSRSVLIIVSCLEGDGEPSAEDHEFFEGVGASRAWSGVTLDQLERAFQTEYQRALAHLIQAGHQYGEVGAEAAGYIAARLTRLHNLTWSSIRQGFRAALQGDRKPDQADRRLVLSSILAGVLEPSAIKTVSGHGQSRTWRLAVIVCDDTRSERLAVTPDDVEQVIAGSIAGVVCGRPVEHLPVIVAQRDDVPLLDALHRLTSGTTDRILVSEPDTIREQVSTYATMNRHLRLVPSVARGSWPVSPRALMRHAILNALSLADAQWFVRSALRPFLGPGSSRWQPIRTLNAVYDADGDLEEAAQTIGLEPRTLAGHMTRVRRELGIAPRQEALVSSSDTGIALRLLRIYAEQLPAPDDVAWLKGNAQ